MKKLHPSSIAGDPTSWPALSTTPFILIFSPPKVKSEEITICSANSKLRLTRSQKWRMEKRRRKKSDKRKNRQPRDEMLEPATSTPA